MRSNLLLQKVDRAFSHHLQQAKPCPKTCWQAIRLRKVLLNWK
ncbi:hypothetical protein [Microcoleus sp.]